MVKTTPNCWETMSILVRSLSLANKFQKLLKSAEKYFYSTFSSCAAKLSKKKIFLVRSEILGLLVNMLTANYEYSSSNRENVPLPIQLLLSEKQKSFWSIFFFSFCLFGISFKFWTFWKRNKPHNSTFSEVTDSEGRAYLMHKRACFRKPFGSEHVKAVNKNSFNVNGSLITIPWSINYAKSKTN